MVARVNVVFRGGRAGDWSVTRMHAVRGQGLAAVAKLDVQEVEPGADLAGESIPLVEQGGWSLRGTTGHVRYVERGEKESLARVTPLLGRPDATQAALIPIRKNETWWDMAQDERRAILETRSHHIEIGMNYLPAIARRLYHCRDLAGPFDFLTWFEFAPADAPRFDDLLARLRDTEEWRYVDRELEIRLERS